MILINLIRRVIYQGPSFITIIVTQYKWLYNGKYIIDPHFFFPPSQMLLGPNVSMAVQDPSFPVILYIFFYKNLFL